MLLVVQYIWLNMKYRITYLAGKLDTSTCPPAIVKALFPTDDALSVFLSEQECIVEFAEPQTPVDLGALVKVEAIEQI
ncbi:hypothetical protein CCP3SC1AL1_400010 [Gammaproteobacteria bacterium]